jgi:hypothetical protein
MPLWEYFSGQPQTRLAHRESIRFFKGPSWALIIALPLRKHNRHAQKNFGEKTGATTVAATFARLDPQSSRPGHQGLAKLAGRVDGGCICSTLALTIDPRIANTIKG